MLINLQSFAEIFVCHGPSVSQLKLAASELAE